MNEISSSIVPVTQLFSKVKSSDKLSNSMSRTLRTFRKNIVAVVVVVVFFVLHLSVNISQRTAMLRDVQEDFFI